MFNAIKDYLKNKAEAEKNKAEAIKARTEAEVNVSNERAKAIASEAAAKAEADRVASVARLFKKRLLIFSGVAVLTVASVLIGDYIYHDYEPFIKWNMKRHIRHGDTVPEMGTITPTFLFPREGSQQLPPLSDLPTLLIGPSGCGKTTALHKFALDLKSQDVPVVMINLRGRYENNNQSRLQGGQEQLIQIAKRVCDRVYYPYRRSFLYSFFSATKYEKDGVVVEGIMMFPPQYYLLKDAINTVFDCCRELSVEIKNEEKSLMTQLKSTLFWLVKRWRTDQSDEKKLDVVKLSRPAPVIIIDEVHDLIKDTRLAKFGGLDLFELIGSLVTVNCIDDKNMYAILASSNSLMVTELEKKCGMTLSRRSVFELPDIQPELIISRLQAMEYSESEVKMILDVAGTRLRQLRKPLASEPRPDILAWKDNILNETWISFQEAFSNVGDANYSKLFKLLDEIELNGFVNYEGDAQKLVRQFDLASIVYISLVKIEFQSRTHKLYWILNRDRLKKLYYKK